MQQWITTLPDGTQLLIRLDEAGMTVATRERSGDIWGPPITAELN